MPVVRTLIQRAARVSVQRAWDEWRPARDEPDGARTSGAPAAASGSARGAYLLAATIVIAFTLVDGFSKAQEIGWRLASPGNLWEPLLWNTTSGAVILALLPLTRRAAWLVGGAAARPWRTGLLVVALVVAFGAVHVATMFPLRQLAYAAAGWHYPIRWSLDRVVYELRKDVVTFAVLAVVFWLAERPAAPRAAPSDAAAPTRPPEPPAATELWLRDGRTSVLVDPREILSVTSAGNYVEYVLAGNRRHLIRATLQAEESRLLPLGIARVHRTRLVNVKRIVALEWRPSGDFEVRLDTGAVIAGSRRFKAAVAGLGA